MARPVSEFLGSTRVGTGANIGPWRRVTYSVTNRLWSRIWMGMPGVVWDNVLHRVKAKVRHESKPAHLTLSDHTDASRRTDMQGGCLFRIRWEFLNRGSNLRWTDSVWRAIRPAHK